jgi:uncharacterized damage-inducible protein DinB
MSGILEILGTDIDYTVWASRRLVNAAAELSEEELNRDFQTAYHSVLGTLVHVFAADRMWLSRMEGAPRPEFVTAADHSLHVLQRDWPALYGRWQEWAGKLTEDRALANVSYKDLRGNQWTQPMWQVLVHVVNHATHHRGQVSAHLRSLGRVPPPIDFTVYCREVLIPLR